MPHFEPGPFQGEQRRNPKPRPVADIKAEIDEMLAYFRKATAQAAEKAAAEKTKP